MSNSKAEVQRLVKADLERDAKLAERLYKVDLELRRVIIEYEKAKDTIATLNKILSRVEVASDVHLYKDRGFIIYAIRGDKVNFVDIQRLPDSDIRGIVQFLKKFNSPIVDLPPQIRGFL